MRIVQLEVKDFRGIAAASISFGPGLTVLHGPNELGKSTLAESIRAALLVSTGSKEGDSYVAWGRLTPARVTLTFESGDKLWRVAKTFGTGRRAVLESSESVESPRFRVLLEGNGVEGKLRELLGWGIASPGGRGAPGKSTSYLTTALLGRQGEVQAILEASLAEDRDGTGKALVTNALGVLGKDPLVARVEERLAERVEAVFTPGGKFKMAADSPLVRIQEHHKAEEERLRNLQRAESEGRVVQDRVVALQADRQRLLEATEEAEAGVEAAAAYQDRAKKKASLQAAIDDCRKQLAEADRLVAELSSVRERLQAEEATRNCLKSEEDAAALALDATKQRLQAASADVARASEAVSQSATVAGAALRQRRAELETSKATLEARLREIASAEQAVAERSALEQTLQEASSAAAAASATVVAAERLRIQALRDGVRGLEIEDRRAKARRTEAARKRSDASRLEQQAAARVLPTREQIAAWRRLEGSLASAPLPTPAPRRSLLVPVAIGLVLGLAAAFAGIALDWSVATAAVAGLVVAVLAGGLVRALASGGVRVEGEDQDRRRILRERWQQEVEPSLRAAGLASLAAYEIAVAEIDRLRADVGRLRLEADGDDVEAAAAERAAASLEDQREELTRLEREEPAAGGAALTARGGVAASGVSLHDSAAQLAQSRKDETEASARVGVLRSQLDAMRAKVDQLVSAFGESLPAARQQAAAALADLEAQARAIESAPALHATSSVKALEEAKRRQAEQEEKVETDKRALDAATTARLGADLAVTTLQTDLASRQGQLKTIDRAALEARLRTACEDPDLQLSGGEGMDPVAARATLESTRQKLERCTSDLNHARGQLHLIAGHVGSERLARQEEAVRYAREEVLERELTEKAALRLLTEIRAAEAERSSHLGRTLSGPITETFRELTGGRYGQIVLDADLKAQAIEAQGAGRAMSALSVGTREQLASLIRLAIAAHLRTAIVLDDQLVHSDSERLSWFSDRLRSSAHQHAHQVIVFTCRPGDYLPAGTQPGDAAVAVVDLKDQVSR